MGPEVQTFQAIYFLVIPIMLAVLTAALAVIGYFIRDLKATMTAKDEDHDKAIEALYKDFNDWRVHVAETYVGRDDFVRSLMSLEAKFDDLANVVRSGLRDLNLLRGAQEGGEPGVSS